MDIEVFQFAPMVSRVYERHVLETIPWWSTRF